MTKRPIVKYALLAAAALFSIWVSEQGQVPSSPPGQVPAGAPAEVVDLPPITEPATVPTAALVDQSANEQAAYIAQLEAANADLEAQLVSAKAVVPPAPSIPSAPQTPARAFQPVSAPILLPPVCVTCGPSQGPTVPIQPVYQGRVGIFGRKR